MEDFWHALRGRRGRGQVSRQREIRARVFPLDVPYRPLRRACRARARARWPTSSDAAASWQPSRQSSSPSWPTRSTRIASVTLRLPRLSARRRREGRCSLRCSPRCDGALHEVHRHRKSGQRGSGGMSVLLPSVGPTRNPDRRHATLPHASRCPHCHRRQRLSFLQKPRKPHPPRRPHDNRRRCISLAELTLPATLETIGDGAFAGCTALYAHRARTPG